MLSAGKIGYLAQHGVDGIIDVSPFSCMNGIVSQALYPRLSQDHARIPITSLYVDGTARDPTDTVEVFLEMARAYRARKPHPRRYPLAFDTDCTIHPAFVLSQHMVTRPS